MKRKLLLAVMLAGLAGIWTALSESPAPKGKYLIILQAGKESREGMARAVHALLYTRELKERGHEVALVFDGAGTEWAEEWTKPDSTNKLTPMYRELSKLGVTEIICDFCAGAFQVKDQLKERKQPLVSEFH